MSRALTTPSTFSFIHKFEELPLFTRAVNGESFRGGFIDGEYEVTVSIVDGTWWISDVSISLDNSRMGTEARSSLVNLDADQDERFYITVLDSLTERYFDHIAETVDEELGEMDLRAVA